MNKILHILLFLAVFGKADVSAQKLVMDGKVELLPLNVYASRNPRTDSDGQFCGVLMVHSTNDRLQFAGAIEGEVTRNAGVYYVYLRPGTTKLSILSPAGSHLDVKLDKITPKCTYQVTVYEDTRRGLLVCTSDPSGAVVTVISSNGDEKVIGNTPIKGNAELMVGVYTITIAKKGFQTKTLNNVEIIANKTKKLGTIKLKKQ